MKILLAVDGSTYTKKMLAYLTTHSELFTGSHEYTVFTAEPPLPPRARAAVGKEVADSYHAEEAERILSPVCAFLLRHGIDAKSHWQVGHAGETIARFANEGPFDLLVMGSVATQVLAHCTVPVLLVR